MIYCFCTKEKQMEPIDKSNLRKIIRYSLIKVGIKCDLVAFNYLCYAVELVILNSDLSTNLYENIYAKIAEKFSAKSISCVERSIRTAIDTLANTKGFSTLNKMFNSELFSPYEKPTPGEFINLMAEYHRTGLYKNPI